MKRRPSDIYCSKCDTLVLVEEIFYDQDKEGKKLSLCIPCHHQLIRQNTRSSS